MQHFMTSIPTQHGSFNFYFNLIYTTQGQRYHVSVIGLDRKMVTFRLKKKEYSWEIENANGCPDWVVGLQGKLSAAVLEFSKG